MRVVQQRRRPRAHHAAVGRATLLARRDAPRGAELAARAVHDDGHPDEPGAAGGRGARRRGRQRRRQDRAHLAGLAGLTALLVVVRVDAKCSTLDLHIKLYMKKYQTAHCEVGRLTRVVIIYLYLNTFHGKLCCVFRSTFALI